tara:strand:+ start:4977 stop:5792 length:816 start_codon:yes stop_codon:yes gene_type:complete
MRIIIILLLLIAANATQAACNPRTELEIAYCQLQAKGARLPTWGDFRRNNSRMQRLLLKRPSTTHGVALPKASASFNTKQTVSLITSSARATRSIPALSSTTSKHSSLSRKKSLQDCSLAGAKIVCAEQEYRLLDNLQNRHLQNNVFAAANVLGLNNYSGDIDNTRLFNSYLGDNYQRYIEGMLRLGLASSTMSYSRFYYTFEDANKNNRDFAARFEKMYVFLKKDKQSMGVKSRYSDEMPAGLHQCVELTASIVVCDNNTMNWVYHSGTP